MNRYPCPCCEQRILHAQPPGTYEICTTCEWEDDLAQFCDPTLEGGPNRVSLEQARANFRQFGVIDIYHY